MNGITHKQAQNYVRLDLDGLLTDDQRRDLETHLSGCEACRAEAQALSTLTSRLQSGFRSRWDAQDGPSKNVMATVRSQTRRIIMSNRINVGLRALGSVAAVLVFGFLINMVISQMRDQSVAANATQTSAAILPEQRLLAFTSAVENGNLDIYTMYPDGGNLTNLTNNPAHDVNPYWSPDGKRLAFMSDRAGFMQIFVMNADGSNVVQLTNEEADHEFGVSDYGPWSPDGSKLLFNEWAASNEKWMLYTVGVDGANKTLIAEVPNTYTSPSWSPDGKHIAFIQTKLLDGQPAREVNRIYVVDADGRNLVDIMNLVPTDEDLFSRDYSWSNDGQFISFIANRYHFENGNGRSALYQASLDGNSLTEIDHVTTTTLMGDWWDGTSLLTNMGTPKPLTWLRPDGTESTLDVYTYCEIAKIEHGFVYERSSDGNLLIGAGCYNDDWWFHWANPDGTEIKQLLDYPIHMPQGSVDMFWSPDGKYVALNAISSDITNLYVVDIATALKDPSIQLVKVPLFGGGHYYNISWQPDMPQEVTEQKPVERTEKRLITFTSADENNALDIYAMYSDGSGLTNLTNNSAQDTNPIWSPDGSRIAFESERDDNREIYILNLHDNSLTRLTNDAGNDVLTDNDTWSPDGKHILYRNDHNGKWDLFVAQDNGSGVIQLTQDSDPALYGYFWSPDGQKVAYAVLGNSDRIPTIYIVNADGTGRQQISTPQAAFSAWLYGWTPGGDALYYYADDCAQSNWSDCSGSLSVLYRIALDGSEPIRLASTADGMLDWVIHSGDVIYLKNKRYQTRNSSLLFDNLVWWQFRDKSPEKLNEWPNVQEKCTKPRPQNESGYAASRYNDWPGADKYMVLTVNCGEGVFWPYLVNMDGSSIQLLTNEPLPGRVDTVRVSADGRLALFTMADSTGMDTYSLDIIAAQRDPSTPASRLGAMDGRIQPIPYGNAASQNVISPTAVPSAIQDLTSFPQKDLIAFVREGDNVGGLYLMDKDGNGLRQLTQVPASVTEPRWSPNGRQILFNGGDNSGWHLYLINADGSGLLKLSEENGWNAVWSPDGKQIAYTVFDLGNTSIHPETIRIVNADGSNLRTIPLNTVNGVFDNILNVLQWSEDGKFIQFSVTNDDGMPFSEKARWTIYQANAQDGSLQTLLVSKSPILNWIGTTSDLMYITNDFTKWNWMRGETILATWSQYEYRVASTAWTSSWWSPDKRKLLIAVEDGDGQGYARLFLASSDGSSLQELTRTGIYNYSYGQTMGWSPDGQYLIFTSDIASPGNYDLYMLDIEASLQDPTVAPVRLTTSGFSELLPAWQPIP